MFKQQGIFNREVADSFRNNILSKGGTEHPMLLYNIQHFCPFITVISCGISSGKDMGELCTHAGFFDYIQLKKERIGHEEEIDT